VSSLAAELADIRALYLHVPFCERKCEYCDFASIAGLHGHAAYVAALRAELRAIAAALPRVTLDTVFCGGGTPSLLPPEELAAVLAEVRGGFRLAADAEVTIEANPSSTTAERAATWRAAGVTRVSVGVQSLEPRVLRFLGRVHSPERALEALEIVREAGFRGRSADLIYAVPGLDDAAWEATLRQILDADPGHLSAYELTVEPGTPLWESVTAGAVTPVNADEALRQHWLTVDLCAAAGYAQYEVSNFARPGHECRHNLAYWGNHFYLAAGCGAHGHLPPRCAAALGLVDQAGAQGAAAVRYWHSRDPAAYTAQVARDALAVAGAEVVDAAAHEAERVMVGLRRRRGVELIDPASHREARMLAAAGLLRWDGLNARVTRRGQELLDGVALRLVRGR